MKTGNTIILMYLFIYIIIPFASNSFLGQSLDSIYVFERNLIDGVLIFIFSIYFLNNFQSKSYIDFGFSKRIVIFLLKWRVFLSMSFLVMSLSFLGSDILGFRYSGIGLKSWGKMGFLIVILQSIAQPFLLLLVIDFLYSRGRLGLRQRISGLALALSTLVLASGTVVYFLAFLLFAIFLFPQWCFGFTSIREANLSYFKFIGKTLYLVIPLVLLVGAIYFGDLLKSVAGGGEATATLLNLNTIYDRLVEGFSSHYFALNGFTTGYFDTIRHNYPSYLSITTDTLVYRFNALFGDGIRPDIQSLSKLNFDLSSWYDDPRQGTSPGLIASFMYALGPWLGFIVALVYAHWLSQLLNRAISGVGVAPMGSVILLLILLPFFQSPPDLLVILDNSVIMIVSYVIILRGSHRVFE